MDTTQPTDPLNVAASFAGDRTGMSIELIKRAF
jgi:hypothetical protein